MTASGCRDEEDFRNLYCDCPDVIISMEDSVMMDTIFTYRSGFRVPLTSEQHRCDRCLFPDANNAAVFEWLGPLLLQDAVQGNRPIRLFAFLLPMCVALAGH